uniref:Uncharacterized protein n=1 Tax=Schizaphis graminum TaxID=13262 RepID=A0A2S2NIK5_SCHGA
MSVGSVVERVPITGLPWARHGHCGRLYLAQIDHVTGSRPDEPRRFARAGRKTAPALLTPPPHPIKIKKLSTPDAGIVRPRLPRKFSFLDYEHLCFSRIVRASVRFSN